MSVELTEPIPVGVPALARVDLDAIASNVGVLARAAGPAHVMAVVKADAYGHGLLPAARAAVAGGAAWLGVAQLAEGIALRAAGVTTPTLAWMLVPGDAFAAAVGMRIDLGVSASWAVQEAAAAARAAGVQARLHLKVDTGLGRGGATSSEWAALVADALRHEADGSVRVVGVWSHLAFADAPDHPSIDAQIACFDAALALAERAGARLEVRHLANSAATLTRPDCRYDLVRPGIAVYGCSPVPARADSTALGLRPAMSLFARLAHVKAVPAGQGVSYGLAYTTPTATRLGIVPLGYADGLPRHAGGTGPVRVGQRTLRVAGRVCMDQIVLDLGPGSSEMPGDVVELFGAGGGPTAEDWARAAGTISYEIVSRLGSRVPVLHTGTAGVAG